MTELEPEADALLTSGKDVADSLSAMPALYSLAISMKRIADAVEGTQMKSGLVDGIMWAIKEGLLER